MAEASLMRTVRFRAGHHYRLDQWTEEENRRVFGAAVDPHEHDWAVEVTVRGPMDRIPSTESLARWFWERLVPHMPGSARLVRVRVSESDTLAAEYEG